MILLGKEEVDWIVPLYTMIGKLIGLVMLLVFLSDVHVNVNMNVSAKVTVIQSDLKGSDDVVSQDFSVRDDPGFGLDSSRRHVSVDASCDVGLEDSLSGCYIACFCGHDLFCMLSHCDFRRDICTCAICWFFPYCHC